MLFGVDLDEYCLCFFQDEFGRIIFCDDDRKNVMGVKRVCNFSSNQLMKIDPDTAMTERDFQIIVNTFHENFAQS